MESYWELMCSVRTCWYQHVLDDDAHEGAVVFSRGNWYGLLHVTFVL